VTKTTLALVSLLGMSGCFVDLGRRPHHDDRYYDDGYYYTSFLRVYWTIDGSTDPAECRQADVSDISILVETRSGETVGEYLSDCRDFETEIELDPGRYYANAVLLDRNGDERTTVIEFDPLSLGSDERQDISVDFPNDSFY
jgi:hypothetical protein